MEKEHFYQIGVIAKRDSITGADLGEEIPIYAKSKYPIGENGMTVEEQNLLSDLAKTFLTYMKKNKRTRKLNAESN